MSITVPPAEKQLGCHAIGQIAYALESQLVSQGNESPQGLSVGRCQDLRAAHAPQSFTVWPTSLALLASTVEFPIAVLGIQGRSKTARDHPTTREPPA